MERAADGREALWRYSLWRRYLAAGCECRVQSGGFRVRGSGCRVKDAGSGCRVQGVGYTPGGALWPRNGSSSVQDEGFWV